MYKKSKEYCDKYNKRHLILSYILAISNDNDKAHDVQVNKLYKTYSTDIKMMISSSWIQAKG